MIFRTTYTIYSSKNQLMITCSRKRTRTNTRTKICSNLYGYTYVMNNNLMRKIDKQANIEHNNNIFTSKHSIYFSNSFM
jgi:transposase-like protein